MSHAVEITPYERFLRESLAEKKQQLELLTHALQKANPFKRIALKRQLEEINQNVQILSSDLEKYERGLSWLREPTKERDEKAEHLGPVDVSAITGQAKTVTPAPVAPRPAPSAVAKPGTTSVPVARPAVPQTASGASAPQPSQAQTPNLAPPPSVKPIGTPAPPLTQKPATAKEEGKKSEEETEGTSSETNSSSS